jgi:hypothetical protein
MAKGTITRWWIWGLVGWIPAGILIPSSALALAAHHQSISDAYGQTMVGLIVLGGLVALAGIVALLAAWVQAVRNTRQLADPRWSTALLWGGLVGILATPLFGLGALLFASVMTAYLVAGPDGQVDQPRPTTPGKPTITTWSGWGFAAVGAGLLLSLMVANLTDPGRPLHGVLWPSLALVSLGFTVATAGALMVGAAWWGALFNAHILADRTWFKRLLWSGIAAAIVMPLFGLGGLILAVALWAYQRSAPDGMAVQPPEMPTPTAPPAELATRS